MQLRGPALFKKPLTGEEPGHGHFLWAESSVRAQLSPLSRLPSSPQDGSSLCFHQAPNPRPLRITAFFLFQQKEVWGDHLLFKGN